MKKELIKTQDYLLVVDDSSINFDDWVYDELDTLFFQYGVEHKKLNSSAKKVIAHLPFGMYSSLEGVPLLPPLEVEDDVEKLAEDLFDKGSDNLLHPQYQMRIFFNIGYNKARDKYNSQPKTPTHFEFEMEYDCCGRYVNCKGCDATAEMINLRHKTTTNSQGQVVACGKYIY